MASIRIAFCLWTFFSSVSVCAAEPLLGRVSLVSKVIDASRLESANIRFHLAQPAMVELKIYNEVDQLIRRIPSQQLLKNGVRVIAWDGKDQNGEPVPLGVYVYVLEAREKGSPSPFLYDPRTQADGEELMVEELRWDPSKGSIRYLLPRAAYVRIRVGLKNGVFLGTLLDWTPLEAGRKLFPWDGRDPSGLFNLSRHLDVQVNVAAFELPGNAIIVRSAFKQDKKVGTARTGLFKKNPLYLHAQHHPLECHEPDFKVEFPAQKQDSRIPVRLILNPKDKDRLVATRFEVMFFVGGLFLFEQEEGTSPITIYIDTERLGPGEHLLTVNIMDYKDHIGVQTVKIPVKQGSQDAA